jgi:large subunit ribosomal protein L21
MSIIFEIKGKQYRYIPTKTDQTFHIDYQKNVKSGDKITLDKILSRDEEFGQPYLKGVKLVGEIIKHGQDKKITTMKYKAKKRTKVKSGHRRQYTEMKIVSVEGN